MVVRSGPRRGVGIEADMHGLLVFGRVHGKQSLLLLKITKKGENKKRDYNEKYKMYCRD